MDLLTFIFINQRTAQLRGAWKVVIFLSIWLILYAPQWLRRPQPGPALSQHDLYWAAIVSFSILTPLAFGESAFCARLFDNRSILSIGVAPHRGWWRDLGLGWGISFGMIALVAAIEYLARVAIFPSAGLNLTDAGTALLQGACLYFLAASLEELMMRGFPLQALLRDYPTWLAVTVMSLIFALFHNANPGFSKLAFLNTFLAGVWLSVAYLKTRSLWLPIGLHTGWNFAMGVIFGYNVSGITRPTGCLLMANAYGSHWLTGGDYGPEAGILATVVILAGAVWLWRTSLFKVSPEMALLANPDEARRDTVSLQN